MPIKVGMVSLGCPKNQVDAELMLHKIREAGYTLETDDRKCDVVIVNTCAFIGDAKKEAIENILELATLKKEGQIKKIIVTGCLPERYRDEVKREIPEVDAVVGIGSNGEIAGIIHRVMTGETVETFGPKEALPLSGERIISNLPFYAYLKIAEGCDNNCAYCAIPSIRGNFRSRTMEDIVKEAKRLAECGVKELIVVAQDITRYGLDIYGETKLPMLLDELCQIDGVKWIRLLYTYPDLFSDELIDTMAKNDKIVKYIDLPFQHVSNDILKAMNRRGNKASYTKLVEKLRAKMPDIAIRTTFITGFPGESEKDFEELCAFVKDMAFAHAGCFAYSPEEDTPAALRVNQIDDETKQRRAEIIMAEQERIVEKRNRKLIGKTLTVAVEGFDRYAESFFGRSEYDAPDIDGKVFFTGKRKLAVGEFVRVKIDDFMDYDLIGTLIEYHM